MNKLKNLGLANSWGENIPQVVKDCKHDLDVKNLGNCLNEFSCEVCGYRYRVDSSG